MDAAGSATGGIHRPLSGPGGCAAWSEAGRAVTRVTGNGKSLEPFKGRSICAYSGLNDNPAGSPQDGPGGRTQSFGQDVRGGFIDPRQFNPGDACNPDIVFGEG